MPGEEHLDEAQIDGLQELGIDEFLEIGTHILTSLMPDMF